MFCEYDYLFMVYIIAMQCMFFNWPFRYLMTMNTDLVLFIFLLIPSSSQMHHCVIQNKRRKKKLQRILHTSQMTNGEISMEMEGKKPMNAQSIYYT